MNMELKPRWEKEKDRPLRDFFVPYIRLEENDLCEDPLLFFHEKAEEQRIRTGIAYGALHFKLSEQLSSKIRLEPYHLTRFNRTVGYKWRAVKRDQQECEAIFVNDGERGGPEHLERLNLLQSHGNFVPTKVELSPESTLEQLDELILKCGRNNSSVLIGIEGDICGVDNLRPLQNFNIYSIQDYISQLDSKIYPDLHGISFPYAISGRTDSVTPIHLEDLEMMSMNMMIIPGIKLWIIVGPNADDINRLVTNVAPSTKDKCPRWYQDKIHMVTVKFMVDHNINFKLVWQVDNDIILTQPHGFHQIVNIMNCVNVARNIVTVNTPQFVADIPLIPCSCTATKRRKPKHDLSATCGMKINRQDFQQWNVRYLRESQQKEKQKGTKTLRKRYIQAGKPNFTKPTRKQPLRFGYHCGLCGDVKSKRHDDFHKKMKACKFLIEKGGKLDDDQLPDGSTTCPICPIHHLGCDADRSDHSKSTMHLRALVLMKDHIRKTQNAPVFCQ